MYCTYKKTTVYCTFSTLASCNINNIKKEIEVIFVAKVVVNDMVCKNWMV